MKIKRTNGQIALDGKLICPQMAETEFLGTECGKASQLVAVNGNWKTYALRYGEEVACNLTFFAGHLRQLSCVKIDDSNDQWDTSQELKQKAY